MITCEIQDLPLLRFMVMLLVVGVLYGSGIMDLVEWRQNKQWPFIESDKNRKLPRRAALKIWLANVIAGLWVYLASFL